MARGRAPFVAVRTDVRKEERVRVVAELAGYNEHEALGRLVELWCWCTDRGLEDAPDDSEGYAVPEAVVRRFLGDRGVVAILGDGCDELAMGQRRTDGLIQLRGTSDTVDRLRSLRTSSRAGGRAQAALGRRSAGRFVSATTNDQPPAGEIIVPEPTSNVVVTTHHQPLTSRSPAVASEIPDPRSLSGELSPVGARAIPQYVLGHQDERPDLATRQAARTGIWIELDRARQRAAAAIGVTALPLLAMDPGERDLAGMLALATTPEALATLVGQAQHAIAMAELEAVEEREVKWLTGAIFAERNFRRLVAMTGVRRDPKRAPSSTGRVEPSEPSAYRAGDQKL